MFSESIQAIKNNELFLCYAFKTITQSSIERLMEIERVALNHFFIEHIDEQTLSHFNDPNYIYRYTARDAVRDGVFVALGRFAFNQIYITSNLFNQGYEDEEKREKLLERGIELLTRNDPEDNEYLKLRVVDRNRTWVTQTEEGITFMKPEDY